MCRKRERARVERDGETIRVGWLVNERELDSLTCLCLSAVSGNREATERGGGVEATVRGPTALVVRNPPPRRHFPSLHHPRHRRRSCYHVAGVPVPFTKTGMFLGLRSLSPRSCSHSAHFLSLSLSLLFFLLVYFSLCYPHPPLL